MLERDKIIRSFESHIEMLEKSGVQELFFSPEMLKKAENNSINSKTINAGSNPKETLIALREKVLTCALCDELAQTRNNVVFGSGNARAALVFVGEAPGFDEDAQGLPFVGKAGQLLTKMIEAMGLTRKDVFICNVLKCRPPQNRNPKPEEVMNCSQYLWSQLDIIKPKLICALGNFAAQTLLQTTKSISHLRGTIHESRGYHIICTFHPAYLLRNPADKKKAWDDLKFVMKELGLKQSS